VGIVNNCTGCHQCVSECPLLKQIGEDPIRIADRGPSVEEAYSCTMCGLCEAVCPASLSMKELFAATRVKAVDSGGININDYRYLFPDRQMNVMRLYRELNGIAYDDLYPDQAASAAFFPGCTLLTYAPELIRASFHHLSRAYKELTLITDCCGMPLHQLGLRSRGDAYIYSVTTKLQHLKVKSLITACPNCYYQLRPVLKDSEIKLMTIYETLNRSKLCGLPEKNTGKPLVTMHDSCPDRFDGIFAGQTRKALTQKGFALVEMEHKRRTTLCCGSGGQVTHFQPELAEELVKSRVQEAERSGAQILASYCLGCVLNFTKIPGKPKIRHVLNLLLDLEQDFAGLKAKANQMFEGPQGIERWEKIMAEEGGSRN